MGASGAPDHSARSISSQNFRPRLSMIYGALAFFSVNVAALSTNAVPALMRPGAVCTIRMGVGSEDMYAIYA